MSGVSEPSGRAPDNAVEEYSIPKVDLQRREASRKEEAISCRSLLRRAESD
jgi:hypothetical protein